MSTSNVHAYWQQLINKLTEGTVSKIICVLFVGEGGSAFAEFSTKSTQIIFETVPKANIVI